MTNETIEANKKMMDEVQRLAWAQFEYVHRLTDAGNLQSAFDSDDSGDNLISACEFAAKMHSVRDYKELRELAGRISDEYASNDSFCQEIKEHIEGFSQN